ncbi:MAG: FkbM family methyltransferase [Acidimicrobiales bacterium]|nr:FkbM family methyltransferase [Acidimicrobiales bacterium]
MAITVETPDAETFEFRATSILNAAWTARPILDGLTYPALPFLRDVRTVLDVGANCGAASVYFAQQFPGATVHAVEPGSEQLECLRYNAAHFPGIVVHPIGLSSEDRTATLHLAEDSGQASVYRSDWHDGRTEEITLRNASAWLAEQGISSIDVLKVDAEMSELEVLSSFAGMLPEVSAIYLEFGSSEIRRGIDRLLDPTHDIILAEMTLDQGECVYLRRDLTRHPALRGRLLEILAARQAAALRLAEASR